MSTENEPGANRWASCSGAPEGSSSHIKQVLLHHFEYNNYEWRSPPHIAETELLFSYFLNKPEETPSQLTASQVTPAGYPIMSQCFWPTASWLESSWLGGPAHWEPDGTSLRETEEKTDFQPELKDDDLITLLSIHLSIHTHTQSETPTHTRQQVPTPHKQPLHLVLFLYFFGSMKRNDSVFTGCWLPW